MITGLAIIISAMVMGVCWSTALSRPPSEARIAAIVISMFCLAFIVHTADNELRDRLTALESRCAPIEQAGELPSFMTERGPVIDSTSTPVTDSGSAE
jgi:hypothetical protein